VSRYGIGSNQYRQRPSTGDLSLDIGSPNGSSLIQQASQAESLIRSSPPRQGPAARISSVLAGQVLVRMDELGGQEAMTSMLSLLEKADQNLAKLRAQQYRQACALPDQNRGSQAASEVVVQVMDDLDKASPQGHWFGPNPQDLGGWGYWPDTMAPPPLWGD
jgi:hypothetical protein